MKLNVLLAVTDSLKSKYRNMVDTYAKYFSKNQGAFLGNKNTYTPREGMLDDPSKRKVTRVVTTVDEKLDYFIKESSEFVDALFSQEKTNGVGSAKAELIVEGDNWGEFTSLELLRLKSLLEAGDLGDTYKMISAIPVRSDAEVWKETTNDEYVNREVYETSLIEGVAKTGEKQEVILHDPNLKPGMEYTPQVSMKTQIIEVGDYTVQQFSGEWSHHLRAQSLKKRQTLLTATLKALKECNNCEAVKSDLTAEKIFGYIFK